MDQASVLSNAHSIIRDNVDIADAEMDAQFHAQALYLSPMWEWTERSET